MKSLLKNISRWFLGLLFVAAGVNHFVNPAFYVRIIPPYLPWHEALVFWSGVAEVGLGGMLFIPRCDLPTRWGLLALLVAVFPANLHMALHAESYLEVPVIALWLRLPIQGLLMWWVWNVTRPVTRPLDYSI